MMGIEVDITSEQRLKALNTALKILDKWQCSDIEQAELLALNFDREDRDVSDSTLERVSYILGIHRALRQTFSCDETVYGWVRKANDHPTLAGASAMDFMLLNGVNGVSKVANILKSNGV